jgi:hypothetical protein
MYERSYCVPHLDKNLDFTFLGKGPVTIPTIVVLGRKVRSNLVSIVQFFCADSESELKINF